MASCFQLSRTVSQVAAFYSLNEGSSFLNLVAKIMTRMSEDRRGQEDKAIKCWGRKAHFRELLSEDEKDRHRDLKQKRAAYRRHNGNDAIILCRCRNSP